MPSRRRTLLKIIILDDIGFVFEIDDVKVWRSILISVTSYALGLFLISKALWLLPYHYFLEGEAAINGRDGGGSVGLLELDKQKNMTAHTGQTNLEIITQAKPPMNMVDSLLCAIANTSTSRKPDMNVKENDKMNISIP
ncbi:hypothetical protein JHK87_033464 [Glycine soja]|nr:hypothetical protein JHK87_033464 [Glycine soja]